MDLTQYAGAKPIFSHVVNEDTTRYVCRLACETYGRMQAPHYQPENPSKP